jgi:hypothetical protein
MDEETYKQPALEKKDDKPVSKLVMEGVVKR